MPLQQPWETLREFAGLLVLLGAVVWGLVQARHRLRPWFFYFWATAAAVSIPIVLYMVAEARAGSFTGWGGLAAIIILLPAAFMAAMSIVALLTLAVLIPKYGFNKQTPEEREAERQRRRDPQAIRADAVRKLKIYAMLLAIALLIVKLRALGR